MTSKYLLQCLDLAESAWEVVKEELPYALALLVSRLALRGTLRAVRGPRDQGVSRQPLRNNVKPGRNMRPSGANVRKSG